jgi:hypothetical protein
MKLIQLLIESHSTEQFRKAIEEYTGKRVTKVDVIPDPKIANVYAIKAMIFKSVKTSSFPIYFLYTSNHGEQAIDLKELEEVEFKSWPPTSK